MKTITPFLENAWLNYQKQLLAFIKQKVNTAEDAEDILSNVFTKLVQVKPENIPNNISAWLYRVTKNQIIDYYRTKKPTDELPDEVMFDEPELDVVNQLSSCILPMIQSLPEEYQQVIQLSQIDNLTNQQVANQLGLSLTAVKSRVLRGREKLHGSLLRCCTINTNAKGQVVQFEHKLLTDC